MDEAEDEAPKSGSSGTARGTRDAKAAVPDAAFDLWLRRGLHRLFDDVAREPVPPELLRLIERDREK